MLSLKSFRKSYSQQLILDIPQLILEPGIHWIKGKNGSGKSTLFNCLSGLSPYQGQVLMDDIDLQKSPHAYKLLLNYSQSEPIFPEFLSGDELIQYFARLKRAPKGQVAQLSKKLGVTAYADQPCGSYSSGMTKKLSLILAFLGEPKWIILDEPLITLDKEAQECITALIQEARQQDVSILFATHQDFENTQITADFLHEVKHQTIKSLS